MMKETYNYVICENENQVYDIRLTLKKQSEINPIKLPKIETLDVWIANEYKDYLMVEHSNDCLLYTSPSPRDSDSSRMPSSA